MRFPMDTLCNYHAMVSVYRGDGSVAVVHGGVEVGQGINTKVRAIASIVHSMRFKSDVHKQNIKLPAIK